MCQWCRAFVIRIVCTYEEIESKKEAKSMRQIARDAKHTRYNARHASIASAQNKTRQDNAVGSRELRQVGKVPFTQLQVS